MAGEVVVRGLVRPWPAAGLDFCGTVGAAVTGVAGAGTGGVGVLTETGATGPGEP